MSKVFIITTILLPWKILLIHSMAFVTYIHWLLSLCRAFSGYLLAISANGMKMEKIGSPNKREKGRMMRSNNNDNNCNNNKEEVSSWILTQNTYKVHLGSCRRLIHFGLSLLLSVGATWYSDAWWAPINSRSSRIDSLSPITMYFLCSKRFFSKTLICLN